MSNGHGFGNAELLPFSKLCNTPLASYSVVHDTREFSKFLWSLCIDPILQSCIFLLGKISRLFVGPWLFLDNWWEKSNYFCDFDVDVRVVCFFFLTDFFFFDFVNFVGKFTNGYIFISFSLLVDYF